MDLQMPEMDGYQATAVIRKELKLCTPIIAMTAHSLVGEKEKCLQIGMNDYVSKPFKPDDLFSKIQNLLNDNEEESEDETTGRKEQADLSYLKELSGGSIDFEKEMIVLFLEKVPVEISTIEAAIANGNMEVIRKTAHKLKSSFSMFALKGLLARLSTLDKLAGSNVTSGELTEHYRKIVSQLDEVLSEMSGILEAEYSM
jgi:response regulator RpfG family c-di-GMP phosphodiesterase